MLSSVKNHVSLNKTEDNTAQLIFDAAFDDDFHLSSLQ